MAQKLDPSNLVSFKELLIAHSVQNDALVQILIEKGLITELEFFDKLKQGQLELQAKKDYPL